MQIDFGREELDQHLDRFGNEWLVTNGLGGYASGTIVGINTRRYHSLLMAAVRPAATRIALLPRLDESVTVLGETVDLAPAEFADGTIYPGVSALQTFVVEDGMPVWSYNVHGYLLRRTLWMIPGHNITVVRYRLLVGSGPVDLALRPLCAARDHHSLQHGNAEWRFAVESVGHGVQVRATPSSAALWLLAKGAVFIPGGDWYWRYKLRREQARGYDFIEDLYQPGSFHATLDPGATLTFMASAEDPALGLPDPDIVRASGKRTDARRKLAATAETDHVAYFTHALQHAADQFLARGGGPQGGSSFATIIAGYHWFDDWGRDAMISLPGLLLATGRVSAAEELLSTFAAAADQGLIPNRFRGPGEPPEYNSADATLWMFVALRATLEAGGKATLLHDLYPLLKEIVDWHFRGTRFGIGMDPADGLLRAGEAPEGAPPTQVTWMDARSGNEVFTPRVGKPVEINALWIEALDCMAEWAKGSGDDAAPYAQAAKRAAASFGKRFWYKDGGYLYDVVDGPHGDDSALRPNQLIALASRRKLVSTTRARGALRIITAQLLTPYGLRTLAPSDPAYIGRYDGDQHSRDRAYHQGTVWPWLLGPYVDACLRADVPPPPAAALIEPFRSHLREAGIGCISEVFSGDPPHLPGGCINQAWSVAELLRLVKMLSAGR